MYYLSTVYISRMSDTTVYGCHYLHRTDVITYIQCSDFTKKHCSDVNSVRMSGTTRYGYDRHTTYGCEI